MHDNEVLPDKVEKIYRDFEEYFEELNSYFDQHSLIANEIIKAKDVYFQNKIPCVYIYPENLGILKYVFQKRMIKKLKIFKLNKELFSFRLKLLINDRGNLFGVLILTLPILIFGDFNWKDDSGIYLILGGVILYQLYRLIQGYFKFFRN